MGRRRNQKGKKLQRGAFEEDVDDDDDKPSTSQSTSFPSTSSQPATSTTSSHSHLPHPPGYIPRSSASSSLVSTQHTALSSRTTQYSYTPPPPLKMSSQSFEFLVCPICAEKFNQIDRCPRISGSCGHSVCETCVTAVIGGNGYMTCPTCRSQVDTPRGAESLPKNFQLLDGVVESEKGTGDPEQCETCDETHDATHVCITCGEEMCAYAAKGHCKPRPSRDHQVVTIEEFKGSPKAREAAIYCPEHNEPYKFFDEDCDKVVCRDCVTLDHREHKCTTLSKAAAKYRDQMGVLAQKATRQARDMREAEDNVRVVGEQLDETRNDVEGEIRNSFAQMRTALDAKEAELLNDLATHHKAKSFILTDQRDRLRTFQACLESAVHRLNNSINGPGDAQLLVARSDVVSTLEAMQQHQPDLQPLTNPALRYDNGATNVLAVIAETCVVRDTTTSAAHTTAVGDGLKSAVPHQPALFTITARDKHGDLLETGGDKFEVDIAMPDGSKVDANVEDQDDGTYRVSYTVPASGLEFAVAITLGGHHIQGSPTRVTSWQPDLSWMETTDQAQGFRKIAGTRIAFAVSISTNFTDRTTYDVPLGYRWATVDEAKAELVKATTNEYTYNGQAGWHGYSWNGKVRYCFYARDSVERGLAQHAGHLVKSTPMACTPQHHQFAGLVCIRE